MFYPNVVMYNITFWSMFKIQHQYFRIPYLERSQLVNSITGRTVKPIFFISITQCLQMNLLSVHKWLELVNKIASFMTYLHANTISLGVVIENCMYVDIRDRSQPQPVFFYCQHSMALLFQRVHIFA